MKMRISPEADPQELGDVRSLSFFGNAVGPDWAAVTLTAQQYAKAQGNRFFEIEGKAPKPDALDHDGDGRKGGSKPPAPDLPPPDPNIKPDVDSMGVKALKAELAELGVEIDEGQTGVTALRGQLETARAAAAAATAED